MLKRRKPGGRLLKALLPLAALVVLGVGSFAFWIVTTVAHPPTHTYLVTPQGFTGISSRGLKTTEEGWTNADGTPARGWLLRGAEGAPGVVLLHGYGADRSWLFNLGLKINETTNFTVLCPDLRAHGQNAPTSTTSFGAREASDATSAVAFLRGLKTQQQRPQVGEAVGLYGVELGAYAALLSASTSGSGKGAAGVLVLDSVPASPDELLRSAMRERVGLANVVFFQIARAGARLYFLGNYENAPACEAAAALGGRKVLLLSGSESGTLRTSTEELVKCFPAQTSVESKLDLPVTGLASSSATGEVGEAYDRLVIDFFQKSLRASR